MDEILSYFGLVAELSVGIIAFQVIAVSFALTKKDHWNYLDNGRFFALIVCFAGSLILSIIPFFVELLPDSQGPQDFAQPRPQEHAGNVPHRALSEPEWIHQIFDQAPGSSFLPLPFDNSLNRKPERSTREEEFRFPG